MILTVNPGAGPAKPLLAWPKQVFAMFSNAARQAHPMFSIVRADSPSAQGYWLSHRLDTATNSVWNSGHSLHSLPVLSPRHAPAYPVAIMRRARHDLDTCTRHRRMRAFQPPGTPALQGARRVTHVKQQDADRRIPSGRNPGSGATW